MYIIIVGISLRGVTFARGRWTEVRKYICTGTILVSSYLIYFLNQLFYVFAFMFCLLRKDNRSYPFKICFPFILLFLLIIYSSEDIHEQL